MIDYLPCATIVLLLATSVLLLALHKVLPGIAAAWIATAALVVSLIGTVALYGPLQTGALSTFLYEWSPVKGSGVSFAVRVDAFSHLLAMLTLTCGALSTLRLVSSARSHNVFVERSDSQKKPIEEPAEVGEAEPLPLVATAGPRVPIQLKASSSDTVLIGWVVGMIATILVVLYAGNVVMLYVAWAATGLCAFAVKSVSATSEADSRSALNFLLTDQLAGYGLLAAAIVMQNTNGNLLLLPSAKSTPPASMALALMAIPAVVRALQYPFSRLIASDHRDRPIVTGLLECLVLIVTGSYLLLRVTAVAPSGVNSLCIGLQILGGLTTVYGLILILSESGLKQLASRSSVVELGLAVTCFASGTYIATTTGLLLVVNHVLSRLALSIVFEDASRGKAVAGTDVPETTLDSASVWPRWQPSTPALVVGIVSLIGLPPFAGFWGRWMLAGTAVGQNNLPLLILLMISFAATAWRGLSAIDGLLATPRINESAVRTTERSQDPVQGGTDASVIAIVICALAALLPNALFLWLVQPAVHAATSWPGYLPSLALTAGVDSLGGWVSACTLCMFLATVWLLYRIGAVAGIAKHRLGIIGWTPLNHHWVPVFSSWTTTERWTHQTGLVAHLLQPERLCKHVSDPIISLGRALGLVTDGIEERHFAPAIILVSIMVLFVFMG